MSTRRSKLNIQQEVLKAIRAGVDKPTRIMYATNMSWAPVRKILDRLVDRGLVSVITDNGETRTKRRYEITEKGISVITYFEGAKELVDIM
jgi:predicted transcriptional regulator